MFMWTTVHKNIEPNESFTNPIGGKIDSVLMVDLGSSEDLVCIPLKKPLMIAPTFWPFEKEAQRALLN